MRIEPQRAQRKIEEGAIASLINCNAEYCECVSSASTSLREAAPTAWFDSAHQPLSDHRRHR
ncbi:MAG: hypothetical protein V7K53_14630 [Nostoc sp.]|uniref:hypothetical protein n=1 Tax=Nostoc sp. TaxID=1180 RepID=UPI002FF96E36